MTKEHTEFLKIVDWEELQYSNTHKKPDPPWPWFKVPRILKDGREWQKLPESARGAFFGLCMMASETGNLIAHDSAWLKNAIQLRPKSLAILIEAGFVRTISLPSDSKEIKRVRSIYSGHRTVIGRRTVRQEGEGGIDRELDNDRERETRETNSDNPQSRDKRSFDQIKRTVYDLATKLRTQDAKKIVNQAHSRNLSEKQIVVALRQLQRDGVLE